MSDGQRSARHVRTVPCCAAAPCRGAGRSDVDVDTTSIAVNGRTYRRPDRPLVVVYLDEAIAAGVMPYLAGVRDAATYRTADCVMPSFTNPNNLSIVTGAPPSV